MRVRALKKDKNDWNQFRHHRDRYVGHTFYNEWGQQMPIFFNAEGMTLNLVGMFRGASAFLVCNGPSFAATDKSALKYCYTMAMNNGIKACLPDFRPTSWICVDKPDSFLASTWLDPAIQKFVPHAHTEKKLWNSIAGNWNYLMDDRGDHVLPRQCPNVAYYHRNEKFMANRYLYEDTVNWGNHSDIVDEYGSKGARCVMLAAIRILYSLGFRTIYLLGADFNMERGKQYSFDEGKHKGGRRSNNSKYDALIKRYRALLPHLDEAGLSIYNCTEDSKLDVFEYRRYDDAIDEALAAVGGVDGLLNERTRGMYGDIKKKEASIQ